MQLAIKILLLFVDGLFNGFLVDKYTACEIHRKSDFGWHRFQNVAYSTSPCLMCKWVKSLKRFWPYVMAFRIIF